MDPTDPIERLIQVWHDSVVEFGQQLEDFINGLPPERARFWGIDLWLFLQDQRRRGFKVDGASYQRLRSMLDELRDDLIAQGVELQQAYTPSADQLARERAAIRARNERMGFSTGAIVQRAPPPNRSEQSDVGLTDIAIRYWIEKLRPLIRSILDNYPPERWLDEAKKMLARVGPPPEFVSRFLRWIRAESDRQIYIKQFANEAKGTNADDFSTATPAELAIAAELYALILEIRKGLRELTVEGKPARLLEALRMLAERFPDLVPDSLSGEDFDSLLDEIQGGLDDFLDFLEALPPEAYALIPDLIQVVLDIVGLFPGFGEIADLISGVLSLERDEWLDAALSLVSLIPLLGDIPGAAKIVRRLKAMQKTVVKLGKGPAREVLETLIKIWIDEAGEITISIEWFKKFWKRFREKLRELTDKLRKDGTPDGRPHGGPGSPTIPGKPDRGAWALGPALRGELLEAKLGKNTPRTFPYIDEWNQASGKAVSIKTTRLAGEVKSVENSLRRAVREIGSFPLRVEKRGFIRRDGLLIYVKDIKQRFLRVGYEPGTDTIEFKQMFDRIKEYATSQGLAGVEFIAVK